MRLNRSILAAACAFALAVPGFTCRSGLGPACSARRRPDGPGKPQGDLRTEPARGRGDESPGQRDRPDRVRIRGVLRGLRPDPAPGSRHRAERGRAPGHRDALHDLRRRGGRGFPLQRRRARRQGSRSGRPRRARRPRRFNRLEPSRAVPPRRGQRRPLSDPAYREDHRGRAARREGRARPRL